MDTTPSGRIRNTVNAPFTTPWIAPLGKLVMNFAGIEFQSYLWLAYLTKVMDVNYSCRSCCLMKERYQNASSRSHPTSRRRIRLVLPGH